jgi:DNA-binding response OmpR family regulator
VSAPGAPAPSVLVVEDDRNLRLTLEDNLREQGYRTASAATAAQARERVAAETYDVVVLDLMLPDADGYTLCRELRARGAPSRILMLTARALEEDVVRGFEDGADDYVAKPYRLRELLARVAALARRAPPAPRASAERLGHYTIDRRARRVLDPAGQPVALTRKELDLLLYLLDHAGEALTRDTLLDAVWGADVVVDAHTVDNFVSSLRRKLPGGAGAGFELASVRGVGYRLDLF